MASCIREASIGTPWKYNFDHLILHSNQDIRSFFTSLVIECKKRIKSVPFDLFDVRTILFCSVALVILKYVCVPGFIVLLNTFMHVINQH